MTIETRPEATGVLFLIKEYARRLAVRFNLHDLIRQPLKYEIGDLGQQQPAPQLAGLLFNSCS